MSETKYTGSFGQLVPSVPFHHDTNAKWYQNLLLPGPTLLVVSWVCTAEHSSSVCWPAFLSFCPSSYPFLQRRPVLHVSDPAVTVLEKQVAACTTSGQQYPSHCPARCQAQLPAIDGGVRDKVWAGRVIYGILRVGPGEKRAFSGDPFTRVGWQWGRERNPKPISATSCFIHQE